jgi:Peptidase family M28
MRPLPAILLAFMISSLPTLAQQSPFLPEDTYSKLVNEISGDIAYDNLRSLVMYHSTSGGSDDFQKEAQWVAERARQYGLEEVHFIDLPAWHSSPDAVDQNWTLRGGELWVVEPKMLKLGDARETPTSVADNSPSADITAELVDVGEGTRDTDYAGKEVAGKVVLSYGSPNKVKRLACWERGAVGIVSYASTRVNAWTEHADQVAWAAISPSKPGEKPAPPVFMVSPRTGLMLSRWLAGRGPTHIFAQAPEGTVPPTLKVHLKVESTVSTPGRQGMVEGFIRGTTYHDQAIVLTAHLQEEKTSANDDRSGCANLLEIARTLEAMIADGRLPRPKRDIRFWWTNEISAEYAYFAGHPEERSKIIADINQDMVGAKQSLGGRVQHVSLAPWSRWSFLNDVIENIVESLVSGNNAYLASWQNGNTAPFSRPIFAHLGSREPYNAKVVPYFDSTDHLVFNDSGVGIPGVTFTNWPDEYIHSSDDDLWQIDSTQLQRNAVAVAGAAYYLASFDEPEVSKILSVMAAAARVRISRDLGVGIELMAQAPKSDLDAAYSDAINLLDQAEQREVAGLETIKPYANEVMRNLLERLTSDLKLTQLNHRKRLEEWYQALGGTKTLPATTERERALAAQVPQNTAKPGEYLRRRGQVEGPKTLHDLMEFEALNCVDGKRSLLDIYRVVRAESLSAGEWYYGNVMPEDIEALFKEAETKGAVEISRATQ